MISHRKSRKWKRLGQRARAKFVKLHDKGWPKYTTPKRLKRWFWKSDEYRD